MFNLARLTAIAGTALSGANGSSSTVPSDRHIEVVNSSHLTVTSFYASNTGSAYCRFDLRTHFADGTIVVRSNIDVCAIGKYTLTD